MKNFYGVSFSELSDYLLSLEENPAKTKIIFSAVYRDKISDFSEIINLKGSLIQKLSQDFSLSLPKMINRLSDDEAEKMLFAMDDDKIIEAAVMKQKYGNSLCISSQIGCNMNCAFCRSGKNKKERNLETSEMVGQIMFMERELNMKISTVTIMGIGEPFDNYDNVMKSIDIINCPYGFYLGQRHISLSTCGIVPKIHEFSKRENINSLAISLHAPNDEIRNLLMPINKTYPLKELINAVKDFCSTANKRVFMEYIMLSSINDSVENAAELADLLKDINCTVNLIPYNDTEIEGFSRSSMNQMMKFYDVLKKNHIRVTMRREFGSSIKAACGQLKSDYIKI